MLLWSKCIGFVGLLYLLEGPCYRNDQRVSLPKIITVPQKSRKLCKKIVLGKLRSNQTKAKQKKYLCKNFWKKIFQKFINSLIIFLKRTVWKWPRASTSAKKCTPKITALVSKYSFTRTSKLHKNFYFQKNLLHFLERNRS